MSNDMQDYMRVTRDFYEKNAREYEANTAGMADEKWLSAFADTLPAGAKVLDVGCAGGRDSDWFRQRGFDVVGIDLSPTFLGLARSRVPDAEFHEMNVLELDFADETFDGIWCSCVLIHIAKADAISAIAGIRRVLRTGGVLYLLVKSGQSEGFETDARYGGMRKYSSYFTDEEMRSLLADFDILQFSTVDRPVDTYRAPDRAFILARKT